MRVRKGIALGLVVGAIGFAMRPTTVGTRLEEEVGLPWLFALRGPVAPPEQVTVVSIDKASAQQLELDVRQWPPSRRIHAAVIRSLTRHKVSAIAMDVWFGAHRAPDDDDALARAMADHGAVVLVQHLDRARVSGAGVYTELLQSPIGQFQESAIGLAPFPLPRDSRTTSFWPFFETAAGVVPTLPAAALQVHALPMLDRFVATLGEAGIGNLDRLPRRVVSVTDLQQLMQGLRGALAGDPAAASRALARLKEDGTIEARMADRDLQTSLLALYSGRETYYLNFYGPPATIPTIPFHELLQPGAPARDDLSGKVVFIGESASPYVTTAEQGDTYPTVYSNADGVDLSGAEIGATAFANLLTGRMLRTPTTSTAVSVLFGFGALIGVIARLLPGLYATALALAAGAAGAVAAQYLFTSHALLVPVAVPLLVQLPIGLFAGVLLRYRDIRKQVPLEVDPDAHQQLFRGVCLATDVAGYTNLTERLSRDELHDLLNDYHEMLRRLVTARRGLVWGRGGDSALCVWKVPGVEAERTIRPRWLDHRRRAEQAGRLNACLAAIEIRDAIDRFNGSHSGAQQLPTRIGLDVGDVGLGPVGGELQAVGSPANTASRIEALNRPLATKLLASADVVRDLDAIATRRLGTFLLRGKAEPVEVVEIVSVRAMVGPRDVRLFARFDEGLALVQQKNWQAAGKLFHDLARENPHDGPTRYYCDLCDYRAPGMSARER